jgi:DNA-binding NtrC family response regulator
VLESADVARLGDDIQHAQRVDEYSRSNGWGVLTMNTAILVVEDEPKMQEVLAEALRFEGYNVAATSTGEDALARLEAEEFDVIITDISLPGVSGIEVLERARVLNPIAAVILITGYATVDTAIKALQKGAAEFLQKPLDLGELTRCIGRVLESRRGLETAQARERVVQQYRIGIHRVGEGLIGESAVIDAVRQQIARCAPARTNVLITGESGVGKEVVARSIHAASPRSGGPFVPVNCGAIPETLLESQLFGHVRGAFTNAVQASAGLFVAADNGTLFLDEIGELPFQLQVKLLRVIEDKQVWAVGATKPVPVDVRLIASTNRDLPAEVAAGRFREDLFYRLNVVHIPVPPLRERRGDIPLLVDHFVQTLNVKLGTTFAGVDREAMRLLIVNPWKGNVRELENVLERAMLLGEGNLIHARYLAAVAPSTAPRPTMLRDAVREFERRHILEVLEQTGYDKREAARTLGISLASLYRKLALDTEASSAPEE